MRRLLTILIVLLCVVPLALIFGLIWTGDRRDWAEVTLVSVNATPDGEVTVQLNTRHANRAGIESGHYIDGVYHGGGMDRGGGFLTAGRGSETTVFSLNPERSPVTGEFTNSPLFGRLLLHVGDTRRIYTGESLPLYDFTASGKRYTCLYRVIPRNAPWADLSRIHNGPTSSLQATARSGGCGSCPMKGEKTEP